MGKKAKCFADGGVIGQDGLTDAQRAKKNAALQGLGMSTTAPAPQQPAPTPAPPLPAPTQPPIATGQGIFGILKNRGREIDKAAGYANGGIINDAAEYWANDNAEFEKTNPGFVDRVVRGVNPLTGFGSAMGAMHTAAGNGDIPGMAMAGIQAIPAVGVLRAIPAAGAMKASVAPSLAKTAGAIAGGAVANAAADEFQKRDNNYQASGYACGGKVKGHALGGKIEGIGTPTSDSIDASVRETGEQIKVSTGERIVSAAQDKLLQRLAKAMGYESLDAYLEAGTGKPVGPTIKDGKTYAADGLRPWYEKDPIASLTESMRSSDEANEQLKSLYPAGTFNDSTKSSPAPEARNTPDQVVQGQLKKPVGFDNPAGVGQKISDIPVPGSKFVTGGAPDGISPVARGGFFEAGTTPPSSAQGGFTQGNKSYNVNDTSQQGISRITATGANPLYTNIKPENAVSGLNGKSMNAIEMIGKMADRGELGSTTYGNDGSVINHQANPAAPGSWAEGVQKGIAGGMGGIQQNKPPQGSGNLGGNSYDGKGYNDAMARSLGYKSADDFLQKQNEAGLQQQHGPEIPDNGSLGTLPGGISVEEWNNRVSAGFNTQMSPKEKAEYLAWEGKQKSTARGQDIAMRGQDITSQRDAERNKVAMRGQDINALSDQAKLAMLERNDQRQMEKFNLDKRISEGALSDSEAQRTARNELNKAIASGDPASIAKAHTMAVASGLKLDREDKGMRPIEIADPNDKSGMRKIFVQPNADGTYTPMQPRQAPAQQRTYAEFEKAYLAKRPGATPDQMKADYQQLYGAK